MGIENMGTENLGTGNKGTENAGTGSMGIGNEASPTPAQAHQLLERAAQVGSAASAGISWPYIATLLIMGAATSIGTLSMSVTTGAAYLTVLVGMLLWVVVAIGCMALYGRGSRLGFQKRWRVWIAGWTVAYAIAIGFSSTARGHNLPGGVIGAVLIMAVTITGALVEARA